MNITKDQRLLQHTSTWTLAFIYKHGFFKLFYIHTHTHISYTPLSNFLPSGSMSFTSKMSSNRIPAISVAVYELGKKTEEKYHDMPRKHLTSMKSASISSCDGYFMILQRLIRTLQVSLRLSFKKTNYKHLWRQNKYSLIIVLWLTYKRKFLSCYTDTQLLPK